MLSMARHLGTLVIAEGVETQEEAVCLLDMDVDMIQGFYFAKPQRHDLLEYDPVLDRIGGLTEVFKRNFVRKVSVKRGKMDRYFSVLMEIQMELCQVAPEKFNGVLRHMSVEFPGVECLYMLDQDGIQVTETIFNGVGRRKRNAVLFRPAPQGSDHTMKDYYYYLLEAGLNKTTYVTEPYLSMASGSSCVTLSSLFKFPDGRKYILCLDINTEALGEEATAP
jgi:hypothetical protein